MSRLPRPNEAALKSGEKIRQLEAEIDAYKELISFIAQHVMAPAPADARDRPLMLDHQRDIAITMDAYLGERVRPHGPATMLEWLRDDITEPGYEVLP